MNKAPYTPMMMQYLSIKEKHPDTLILFRLGDFYEFFFDDAKVASKELQLVLTGKNAGSAERVPMCGVPYHAINNYIAKLISRGYKVGVVEQMEDPALAKGLVERDVIQIMTPGAYIESSSLDNNYLTVIDDNDMYFVVAYADLATGELGVVNVEHDITSLESELTNLSTREIVVRHNFSETILQSISGIKRRLISREDDEEVLLEWESLLTDVKDAFQMKAVARLIHYLGKTQRRALNYLQPIKVKKTNQILQIDAFSRSNLELLCSLRNLEKHGSLFWLLDTTKTAMGTRLLQQFIVKPSSDLSEIIQRQNMIESLIKNFIPREDLSKKLGAIYDLERLIGKIGYGNANGRDLLQLKQSLKVIPDIKSSLKTVNEPNLNLINDSIDDFSNIYNLLEKAIDEDTPITIKEGGIFKVGYNNELDELIKLSTGGKDWIGALEAKEREKTGIRNLKIGFNKVFGYYIEISNGNLYLVKPDFNYERKQTLTTSERFITPELKKQELLILSAEDRRMALEYELFVSLRKQLEKQTSAIQKLSSKLALVDVLTCLSSFSSHLGYVRPTFNNQRRVLIKKGRHPVIEKVMKVNKYVVNDVDMNEGNDVLLITGPNMGGKSTYMRQVALIVILAQMGCYVPAESADLMVFDSIFTRIGASDDLVSGQSTFMVEMTETNYAIRHATENSLLIFDEIGRGTATYDGMALAQAIIEYITSIVHAKTLFSTHYHELTILEKEIHSLRNVQVCVLEEEEKITFLYKVAPGAMNKSYGINVARLAHLPDPLLSRAKDILHTLEKRQLPTISNVMQNVVKKEDEWIKSVKEIDPLSLTPMEALQYLFDLKKKIK